MKIGFLCTDNRENFREYDKPEPYFGTAPEALLQGFAQLPEVEVHVITCAQRPLRAPAQLAPNIFFHSLLVPKIGWLRTGYQGCIRAVRRTLRAVRPDIVHAQGTERDCGICGVWSGFPNVLTVHGNMRVIARVNHARPLTYQWLAARLEALTLPRTDGVVCISRYTQEAVSDLARRTWVVPNAVDASFFDVVPRPQEPPTVLCVGNIGLRKNQVPFIRALDGLAARRPFRALFLGAISAADPVAREFTALVRERPWCEFGGFADRAALKGFLSSATLLALPSLEDNCPMVVLEAMAAGVPVLAANVGGVPDLVRDGVDAVFCDPTDAKSMADGVEKLLREGELRRQLAQAARESARARFHSQSIAGRHVEIYREVLRMPR